MADLYIRSSDGCILTKVKTLNIESCESCYVIYGDLDYSLPLGAYKTEERAKEVLDEIQFMLTPRVYVKTLKGADIIEQYDNSKLLSIGDIPTYNINDIVPINAAIIYEMPEK